jgi:prepilin-type processing-associated H-X9-DG protein
MADRFRKNRPGIGMIAAFPRWLPLLLVAAAAGARAGEPAAPAPPPEQAAPPPAAETEQPLPSPVLAYVPAGADLAVFVRVDQLVRTGLWKSFTAPQVGYYQKLTAAVPLRLDFERDVAAAALVLEIAWKDGKFLAASKALILETKRDVQAGDLLKGLFKARPLGAAGTIVYPVDSGPNTLALPGPRVVVLAFGEGEAPATDFLARILETGQSHHRLASEPLPVAALAAPGDATFAARISPAMKDAVMSEYAAYRQKALRPHMDGDQAIAFGLYYNQARLAMQAETVTGSLDLSRQGDALRADLRFASREMAPFMVAVLQAMADPLQMCLPSLAGGEPLEEPPAEPFYRAAAEGPVVHVVMPRVAAERLVDRLASAARNDSASAASAANLRRIGEAVAAYVAGKGSWPQNWSALTKAGLVRDTKVFENPGRPDHLVTGDYELVPLTKAAAERRPELKVLAYEILARDVQPRGLNVLFADGSVQYIEYGAFQQLYRQTLESLGR